MEMSLPKENQPQTEGGEDSDSYTCSSCGYKYEKREEEEIQDCDNDEEKLFFVPMLLKKSALAKATYDGKNLWHVYDSSDLITLISCSPKELKKALIDDDNDVFFSAILKACPFINDYHKCMILPKGPFREKLWWEKDND